MNDGISIDFDTKQADRMLGRLLDKVERPAPLMRQVEKFVHALTMKMFRGRRPDNAPVRGVSWPKLAESTKWQKRAKRKRGILRESDRPLVGTAKMRDSLRTLKKGAKGFEYGTRVKSKKGFPYPALHNVGGPKLPQRLWLFLTRQDYTQMEKMTVDYLEDKLKGYRNYVKSG